MVTVTQLPEGCKADAGTQSKVFPISCNQVLKNIPEMTVGYQEQIKKRSPIN